MTNRGLYALLLHLEQPLARIVGALGPQMFHPGWYAYVGSARRNLRQRVERHLRGPTRIRWHIDYLTSAVHPVGAMLVTDGRVTECSLSQRIGRLFGVAPISGFGASDCTRCPAHLWYSAQPVVLEDLALLTQRGFQVRSGSTRVGP